MEITETEIEVRVRIRTVKWDGPWDSYRRVSLHPKGETDTSEISAASGRIQDPGNKQGS